MTRPFKLTSWPPAPTKAHIRGKKAQRVGRQFQEAIKAAADFHRESVALEELPNLGARRVGGGKLIPTTICVDFIGAFNGLFGLYFDAKSVGPAEVSFNVATMVLTKPHQLHFLRRMAKAGQVAGYLIECNARQEYLWLDVKHVDEMGPIRFERDGVLCRQFVPLGDTLHYVDFKKLREAYAN